MEWDRVHLASVSNYSFPSGADDEYYRGQPRFVRDSLNLTEEALEQTKQLHMGTLDEYVQGDATREARKEIAAERLRLLYVGITRARQELVLTYNTGRFHDTRPNGARSGLHGNGASLAKGQPQEPGVSKPIGVSL